MKDENKIEFLRVLEDYDFTIQEYVADGGMSVISGAVARCSANSRTGDIDADGQNFIAGRVERMFLSKLSEKTVWLSDPTSGRYLCDIDGFHVSGEALFLPTSQL